MSFRRPKSNAFLRLTAWIEQHRTTLLAIGVSPSVLLDEDHWQDFLSNGHLHWHSDGHGFNFRQLSRDQLESLQRFLEHECLDDQPPQLLSWIRVRLSQESMGTKE
jgi:hypothetical protein